MNEQKLSTIDLSPLYRNSIGIDRLFDNIIDRAQHGNIGNYPPYNIIAVDDDRYIIEVAVAGFTQDDITVTVNNGMLIIDGRKIKDTDTVKPRYLHQGISAKSFQRSFAMAEYVEVRQAEVKNGILCISLERIIPDEKKPRQIEVTFA